MRGPRQPLLGFAGIGTSTADEVVVPRGYRAKVLIAWGEPVSNGPAFKPDASNTAAEQAQQWGMHNDGIVFFPFPFFGNHRGLIVQNHEYTDDVLLFADGKANWNAEKTAKSQAAHGVGVIEVFKLFGDWRVRRPSFFARRITAATPINIAGPAAGHELLKTSADPSGTRVLGTLNNCAMGFTPWGTYLACEENFNGYFKNASPDALATRYGVTSSNPGVVWHTTDSRFDADGEPNEPNRFGWVTEIIPWLPKSTPVKRTALGRVKHEGAWVEQTDDGRVVVYMGDDQAGEYIYRYLSNEPWKQAFLKGKHPLDDGVLYVAKFNADGTGNWLPLTPDNPALARLSQAEILINTRAAADAVGATKMDRPEWIDVIDSKKEVYVTLTNNTGRTAADRRRCQIRDPTTSTGTSSGGATQSTSATRSSSGRSSPSPAIPLCPNTGRRSWATSSARLTASTSTPTSASGSRRTSRAAPSTRAPTQGSGTTRCLPPIPRPRRSDGSSSAPTSARSPAASRRRTGVRCSSASSIPERRLRATTTRPTPSSSAPGRMARRAEGRDRHSSS